MRYRFLVCFISICLSTTCFGQLQFNLQQDEVSALRIFFKVLTQESEAGYVFFNKKPVCIHGYYTKDVFAVNSPIHKQAVALKEGARIWKQVGDHNSDILIHIGGKEEPNIPGYIHILVINVPLFHKIVKQSLPLFQYVLGPDVTSESLLSILTSKDQTFHSTLKDDKVLIGEILGFGTENSLYVSRVESIQEAFETIIPPFLPIELLASECDGEFLPIKPSFGFKSLKEELQTLEEKINLSSEKLASVQPEFIFGWLKDSEKGKNFVSELERTQEEIQKLLDSPLFLEKTIEKISEKNSITICTKNKCDLQINKDDINKIVARAIWDSLHDYDSEYLSYFIEGMEKPSIQNSEIDRIAWFAGYRREFIEGKENLKCANEFFQKLDKCDDCHQLVSGKLYTRTLKNGQGVIEAKGPLISLEYTIFSPLGHCLAHQSKATINLKNTIPGFARGVKGMKVGETREIFIHPSLAYGFDTNIDKCIYLKAIVTLQDIYDNSEFQPNSEEINLSFLADSNALFLRNENYKNALFQKGSEIANHLKKCKDIELEKITQNLKNFHSGKESFIPTTQAEQDLINKIHWNIYFGNESNPICFEN